MISFAVRNAKDSFISTKTICFEVSGKAIVGWHVSQLMLYGAEGTGLLWDRVTAKVKDPLYSVAKLHNECLGFSYDVGSKLITESQLRACTNPDIDFLVLIDVTTGVFKSS